MLKAIASFVGVFLSADLAIAEVGLSLASSRPKSIQVGGTFTIDPITRRPIATNGMIAKYELPRLTREAEAGNLNYQRLLANYHWKISKAFPESNPQAYKWAALAASQNDREGKYLLKEMELFMTPEDIRAGQDLVLLVPRKK